MQWLQDVPWHDIFVPEKSPVEIILRGTLAYLGLFFLLRLVMKRQAAGRVSMSDLLLVVLIADASQNAMAGDYHSMPDGLLLVGTILFWCYMVDWAAFHWKWFGRFVHPHKLLLVKDGAMLHRNMRQEYITPDELCSKMRENGIDNLAKVKRAYMEGDGNISFIGTEG